MCRIKYSTLIFIVLFLVKCDSMTGIKRFYIIIPYDSARYRKQDRLSEKTNSLFSVNCEKSYGQSRFCKMSVEIPVSTPNNVKYKECDFTVNFQVGVPNNAHTIKPLNDSYVVYIQSNYDQTVQIGSTFYIIRMTDCHVVTVSVESADDPYHNALQWADDAEYIDVLYASSNDDRKPDYTRICRQRFRIDGKLVRGPMEYLRLPDFKPTDKYKIHLSTHLLLSRSVYYGGSPVLYRVNSNGETKEIYRGDLTLTEISTTNSKISFCDRYNGAQTMCKQYDSTDDDKLLIDVHVNLYEFTAESKSYDLFSYNMREEGLIIVIVSFSGDKFSLVEDITVLQAKNNNKLSKKVYLNYDFDRFKGLRFHEVSDDDTQVCVKLIADEFWRGEVADPSTFTLECIAKDFFVFP